MEIKNVNDLSTIEWKIYNYLKERTMQDKWTTQIELVDYLATEGINITKRNVRRHISNIRESEVIQKIIISSCKYGYRIMSDENEREYLIKRKISILNSLKKCNKDIKRFNMNGQMKIMLGKYERGYIESLLNTAKEQQETKE